MAARKRQLQPVAASEKDASAFRTISEVADELDVRKHVLRFWEGKFPQLKPMKRAGNRRLYRPEDLELLLGIKHLLHGEGYTIKGVQRILKEDGVDAVKRLGKAVNGSNGAAPPAETAKPARKPRSAAGAKTASTAPTPLRPRATQSVPVLRDAVEVAIKELEASRLLLLGDPDGAGTGKPMARGAARQR